MKKVLHTFALLSLGLLLVALSAQAQSPTPNIALQATASHSGGGSPVFGFGADQYNNGIITGDPVGCPGTAAYPWGWVSSFSGQNGTNSWIQFDWPTPQIFGEITFYYAYTCRRYMEAGDVQIWNTSTNQWQTVHSFAFGTQYDVPVRSFQFPPVTASRMRLTNYLVSGIPGQQRSNPAFREIEIRNVCTDPPTDVSFSAPAFMTQPGDINIDYSISRPYGTFDATLTFKFYTPTGVLVLSESTVVPFSGLPINGTYVVSSSTLAPGFYKLEVTFNVFDICNFLADVVQEQVIMVLAPGQTLCEVWPGDVNDDNVVNYGDRGDLNTYIHDANLSPLWLTGPARYRSDQESNPLTYYTWELQPGVPWNTAEGCYMDTDGNGVVNNFDYIAIKLNWMKTHGYIAPKNGSSFSAATFDMDQNYPNPFNPSTSIRFSVPERSDVRLVVVDILGREVAELVNGTIESGVHTAQFDASTLSTGQYIATVQMTGRESGLTFSKSIKMTLSK